MKLLRLRLTPLTLVLFSLLAIVLLVTTTSPNTHILLSISFFLLTYIFLISLGYFLLGLMTKGVSVKNRRRVQIGSAFVVIAMMFQTTSSLNLISALTLLILGIGFLFYSDKRNF